MCGIFSAWNVDQASNLVYLGLYAQQHRGQESVGIISTDGNAMYVKKKMRLVSDGFNATTLGLLKGHRAVGHVRYSTTGANTSFNIQPLHVAFNDYELAMAHNGNLVNSEKLRDELDGAGAIFQSTSDTELIFHLMARSNEKSLSDRFVEALKKVQGAFSLLMMTRDKLYLARDPYGYRPLVLGKLHGGLVAASETCAFDLIGAEYIRDIEPGEVVEIDEKGNQQSYWLDKSSHRGRCIFEHIYFARPDSNVFGRSVYRSRKEFGKALANEHPIDADIVVPVPDSGVPAAMGYAEQSGIPFEFGLIRNHYVHRTFIEPDQSIRNFGVKIKLNPQREILDGKRIVVIDDSIVRGTTSRKIVSMLREAGAKEVHMRISSAPFLSPCYFGIDTPTKGELIASKQSVDEIAKSIGVDSLGYLSVKGLLDVMGSNEREYCTGCFSGVYPEVLESLNA